MHRAEYTYHKAKASAYAHAGLSAKARSHSRRAAYYRTAFGAKKTHMIFVLSPLNAAMEKKLDAMLNTEHEVQVYIQGFSNPALYTEQCGDESSWDENKCKNILPAQFNQYASDDPLALVNLINNHKHKDNVRFYIVPTQIVKNKTFNQAMNAELKQLLLANWSKLDGVVQRKIIAWHNRKTLKTYTDLKGEYSSLEATMLNKSLKDPEFVLETLFDPFVAYIVDNASGPNGSKLFEFVDAEVGEDARLMPTIGIATGKSTVKFVRHSDRSSAVADAKQYAQYVVRALTSTIGDSYGDNEISIVQDWADWDNPIAAKCILYTVPGAATLYSVGRPVESQGCGMLDFAAKWDGSRPSGRAPAWPPCSGVDSVLSAKEAVNVAATWVAVFRKWRESAPKRILSVVNAGFTKYHGMNPAMHSPIVDLRQFSGIYPINTDPVYPYSEKDYDAESAKTKLMLDTLGNLHKETGLSAPVTVL
jgi:hypothetical protein